MKTFIFKTITLPLAHLYWRIFKPKTSGARALIVRNGRVLLVQNMHVDFRADRNVWLFPGGKLDDGESPDECVRREVFEELGIMVAKTDYQLGEYLSTREGKRDTIHIFVITAESDAFTKQWELVDAAWFDLDHLPKNTSPATARRIAEYRTGERDVVGDW